MSTATVTYKGSFSRGDGGWDTIEITVPTDATEPQIDQAIATWHIARARALSALTNAQPAPEPPASPKQRSYIDQISSSLGWYPDQLERFATERGTPLDTLTKRQASDLIDALKQQQAELVNGHHADETPVDLPF